MRLNALSAFGLLWLAGQPAAVAATKAKAPVTAAEPLCPALKKLIAAAGNTPSFASVTLPLARGALSATGKVKITAYPLCSATRFTTPSIADSYSCMSPDKVSPSAVQQLTESTVPEISACLASQPFTPSQMHRAGAGHLVWELAPVNGKPVRVVRGYGFQYAYATVAVTVGGPPSIR